MTIKFFSYVMREFCDNFCFVANQSTHDFHVDRTQIVISHTTHMHMHIHITRNMLVRRWSDVAFNEV